MEPGDARDGTRFRAGSEDAPGAGIACADGAPEGEARAGGGPAPAEDVGDSASSSRLAYLNRDNHSTLSNTSFFIFSKSYSSTRMRRI